MAKAEAPEVGLSLAHKRGLGSVKRGSEEVRVGSRTLQSPRPHPGLKPSEIVCHLLREVK